MTYAREAGVPHQKLDEETIVVDPRTREVHLFNETAARIWELLAAPQTLEDLTGALADEYDAPADEVRASVEETLALMQAKGLLAAG